MELDTIMNKKVTVIIPVYNAENYLRECLNSVVNQTYKNIEIIAVNDGSTDDSLNILNQYEQKYDNIYVLNQENQGQSVARNRGIEIATGDYIYFLDSDDYIATDTFQVLIDKFEEHNVDLVKFSAEVVVDGIDIQVNENKYNFDKHFKEGKVYSKDEFLETNIKFFNPSPVLYMVKKELLQNNKIWYKPGIIHEDDLFTVEIVLNTNKAIYVSKNLYKRRFRENSVMTTTNIEHRKKSFKSKCIIITELKKIFHKYTSHKEKEFIHNRINKTIRFLARNYPEIDYRYKIREIKSLGIAVIIKYHYFITRMFVRKLIEFFTKKIK